MNTCTTDGCSRPHRARGLCSMHWKREYGKSTLYAHECAACGAEVLKQYRSRGTQRPTCSMLCRHWVTHGSPALCRVPASHPSRYVPPPIAVPLLMSFSAKQCLWCGVAFLAPGCQIYCTRNCKVRHGKARRRGREAGSPVSYTWTEFMRVFLSFDRHCAYCEQPIDGQPEPDHVVPLSRHGSNGISNILPACKPCNSDKRDLLLTEWNADRARRGLPPRTVEWLPTDPRAAHLTRALRHAA